MLFARIFHREAFHIYLQVNEHRHATMKDET
jgi:hypothetical protein